MQKHYTRDYIGVDAAAARIRYLLRDYNRVTQRDYLKQLFTKAHAAGYITPLEVDKLCVKYDI